MTHAEAKSAPDKSTDLRVLVPAPPPARRIYRSRRRTGPILITFATTVLALAVGWAAWHLYSETPWTRDATVRVYVVPTAPEVEGRIVELPLTDNEFVHKGDLLVRIDPTNFSIAVRQAEATLQQAQAGLQNVDAQIAVQQAQIGASQAQVDQARATLVFAQEQAARFEDLVRKGAGTVENAQQFASQLRQQQATLESAEAALRVAERQIEVLKAQRASTTASIAQATAQLDQAKINLARTEIRSPVNGWVTNLLARVGDYASVGRTVISLVDADSFWIDAYFEETQLASIHEGDPAKIKLMGYDQLIQGEVGSVARAINVPNAQPDQQGLATVNPIFTWVRLAQRMPVRIRISHTPVGVRLIAGMTATVEVEPRRQLSAWRSSPQVNGGDELAASSARFAPSSDWGRANPSVAQFIEKLFRRNQIGGADILGKAVIDRTADGRWRWGASPWWPSRRARPVAACDSKTRRLAGGLHRGIARRGPLPFLRT
jgi:multidrug resistance efflux pump